MISSVKQVLPRGSKTMNCKCRDAYLCLIQKIRSDWSNTSYTLLLILSSRTLTISTKIPLSLIPYRCPSYMHYATSKINPSNRRNPCHPIILDEFCTPAFILCLEFFNLMINFVYRNFIFHPLRAKLLH